MVSETIRLVVGVAASYVSGMSLAAEGWFVFAGDEVLRTPADAAGSGECLCPDTDPETIFDGEEPVCIFLLWP